MGAGGPDRVGAVPEKLTINFMQPKKESISDTGFSLFDIGYS